MITIYCRAHHTSQIEQCQECSQLLCYAEKRLSHCPFQENKPTCGKCTVHCYKSAMKEKIRKVMRYSGPRMIYHHPIMAIRHILDGFRKPLAITSKKKTGTFSNTSDE